MYKTWCKLQDKKCDYLDITRKCNYEEREGVSHLDCENLIQKYPYQIKITCGEWDYKEIGYSWCCDLNKKNNNDCVEGCLECFKEHGVEFEILPQKL